jgi:16S rRNA pseudouridine516 synthase
MLNKPAGVITATVDPVDKTVMELVDIVNKKDFFPVGRLDKDTVGLLIITNDGELAHKLLSPKYHVDKTYLVEAESELTDEDISKLENGVDIGDDKVTMPASVQRIESKKIRLTIREGRYHQVKRMLEAVGNKVICLKRLSFGAVWLDDKLEEGEFRELTSEETESLKGN